VSRKLNKSIAKLGFYSMTTGRLEAFTDGVIAIIITIMVLELKVPSGHEFATICFMPQRA
jgi:uncharacterized membrane protein